MRVEQQEVVTDASRLHRNDDIYLQSLSAFDRLTISGGQTSPTNVKSRVNSCTDEESDASSECGRSSRGSSRKGSEDSENLEEFKRTILQHGLSTESDKSTTSIEAKRCEIKVTKSLSGSSSELSDEDESDSTSESDDDEDGPDNLIEILKELQNIEKTELNNRLKEKNVANEIQNSSSASDSTKNKKNDNDEDDTVRTRGPIKYRGKSGDTEDSEEDTAGTRSIGRSRYNPYERSEEQTTLMSAEAENNPNYRLDDLLYELLDEQPNDQITETPNISHSGYNFYNCPTIFATDPDQTVFTPTSDFTTWNSVQQPLSSASSSNTSEYNDRSPLSYTDDTDPSVEEYYAREVQQLFLTNSPTTNDLNIPANDGYHNGTPSSEFNNTIPNFELIPNEFTSTNHNSFNVPPTQANLNVDHSIGHVSSEQQTGFQQYPFSRSLTPPIIDAISYSQPISSSHQYQPHTSVVQNIINQHFPARGTVTVNTGHNFTPINGGEQNIPEFVQNGNWSPLSSCSDNSPVTSPRRASMSPVLIPETVKPIEEKSSSPERESVHSNKMKFYNLKSTSALDRLESKITENQMRCAMAEFFVRIPEELTEGECRNTELMNFLSKPKLIRTKPHWLVPLLSKIPTSEPEYLMKENKCGHDALYLAMENCPEYAYVSAVVADCIMAAHGGECPVWKRTYGERKHTLMHELASRGDEYMDVLLELLTVKTPDNVCPFDLSAQNRDGVTPLHVAVQWHDKENNVSTVKIIESLLNNGADPTVQETKDGNTPLHIAISKQSVEVIKALLCNDGGKAIDVRNNAGKTPLDLARAVSNNQNPSQYIRDYYYLIIGEYGESNVLTQPNETLPAFTELRQSSRISS